MRLTYQTPPYLRLLDSIRVLNLIVVFWILSQLSSFVHATDVELPLTPAYEGEHGQQGSSLERESAVLGMIIAAEREGEGEAHEGYRGEFAYLDPSLVGRAPEGVATLKLGEKMDMEANPGTTSNFVLERSGSQTKRESEGDSSQTENTTDGGQDVVPEKRQAGRTIYISVNTCRQPNPDTPIAIEDSPQLKVYISTSTENQKPGPKAQDNLVTDPIPLVAGAANYSLRTDSDVYIGVETLPLTRGWKGSYRFEVAASTDKFYHSYNGDDPFLFMIDTDSESSLFITHNITRDPGDKDAIDKWLQVPEIPFNMYVFPEQSWGARGLEHSLCGIREAFSANNTNKIKVDRTMTDRYGGKLPKAQFHVQNLQRSQNYTGFLLMDGNVSTEGLDLSNNLTVGKGGKVWKQFSWKTKADDSCQVIFGLNFCTDVAYAVPSSLQFKTNTTGLAALYDTQAASYFRNFSRSLAQIPCDTTSTAQYSLARTCDDCAADYKSWLCSVLLPRCEDFSASDPWLQERNIATPFANGTLPYANNMTQEFREQKRDRFAYSRSRNKMIDDVIKPGPYKELLPCEDLCFDIVRSCPAQLGFQCPDREARALQYGKRDLEDQRVLKCNFPGAVVDLNTFRAGAERRGEVKLGLVVGVALAVVGTVGNSWL